MIADVPASSPSPAASKNAEALLATMRTASRQSVRSYEERVDALDALSRRLRARQDAIVQTIASDFGHRSRHETLAGEVFPIVSAVRHAKAQLRDWMEPDERETHWSNLPSTCQVIYQPLGVVGIVSPWNYPVLLALGPLVGALAAGNRALLKPSELAPRTAELLSELVAEAFAPDLVGVVTGGPEVARAFTRLPFDHLVFTGSTRVGRLVMGAAAENLVPVTLELGGKSPVIVGPDHEAGAAGGSVMAGKLFSAGQTCIAPDYALVPRATRAAFVEGCRAGVFKMYPSLADNPDYTSIASDAQYARLRNIIDDARAKGAEIVELNARGEDLPAATRKIAPTLVLDPTDAMLCMQEELFGPVLPIVGYGQLDDAIRFVNERPRPLALYYFGHARANVERVLAETVSGGVTINETLLHILQDDLPFGGVGPSGMGAYHGRDGFEAFSHKKAVYRQSRISTRGLLFPPFRKTADWVLRLLVGR